MEKARSHPKQEPPFNTESALLRQQQKYLKLDKFTDHQKSHT